jgi:REP element-mobilizing transposase RayT
MNARIRRAQLRHGAFHITAQTQGKELWFVPDLRTRIAQIITGEIHRTDATLLAFAVMPNHIHIILRQLAMTLGRLMQPVMRRIALAAQRHHGLKGHVFGSRFYSGLLETPDHLRESIVYVHRNPVEAELCDTLDDYAWTSHRAYTRASCPWETFIDRETGLRVFGDTAGCDVSACLDSYLRWVSRRNGETSASEVQLCEDGNNYFGEHFATIHEPSYPGRDLRDAALRGLRVLTNDYQLDDLKGSYLSHHAAGVRRQVIAFLIISEYRTGQISRLFGVSPGTVSKVADQLKWTGKRKRFTMTT